MIVPRRCSTFNVITLLFLNIFSANSQSWSKLTGSVAPSVTPLQRKSLQPSVNNMTTLVNSTYTTVNVSNGFSTDGFRITTIPSMAPSSYPTTAPSIECHDLSSYQSPLNLLPCSAHRGTDCFQWKSLGLTPDHVEDLINSCPVSCDVACGSLLRFEASFTYRMLDVLNFLAPETTVLMETSSIDYLTKYVRQTNEAHKFSLDEVQLVKQRILDYSGRRSLLRSLDSSSQVDIEVYVAFRGFVLDLDLETVESFMYDGLTSPGYIRALQFTDEAAFEDLRITFDLHDMSAPVSTNPPTRAAEKKKRGISPWTIAISFLGSFFFCLAFSILYKQKRHRFFKASTPKEYDSNEGSPAVSIRSPLTNAISFESVARILSSFSPRSDTATSESNSTYPPSSQTSKQSFSSPNSESSLCSEEEHPFAGVIPPMLVYDGIDEAMDTSVCVQKVRSIVPSKSIQAQPSFVEALRGENRSTIDESTYEGLQISRTQDDDGTNDRAGAVGDDCDLLYEDEEPTDICDIRQCVSDSGTDRRDFKSCPQKRPFARCLSDSASIAEANTMVERMSLSGADVALVHDGAQILQSSFLQSLWNRGSPRKARKSSNLSDSLSAIVSESVSTKKRHRSCASESSLMETLSATCSFGNSGSQLVFQAPRMGKLGLVIQCIDKLGPIISHVKDYSPLLGKLVRGDRILDIDGQGTEGMTLKDVTGIMGGTVAQADRWASLFRIVVWRTTGGQERNDLFKLLNSKQKTSNAHVLNDSYADPHSKKRASFATRNMAGTPPKDCRKRSAMPPRNIKSTAPQHKGRIEAVTLTPCGSMAPLPPARSRSSSSHET